MAMTPAIFLDKDGTVLQDVPYNCAPAKMAFAPGASEGLRQFASLGLPIFVISNQPALALGKFSFDDLSRMQAHLARMFEDAGATLSGFYFCPHHPDAVRPQYRMRCECRKPAPGLIMLAAQRHDIDLARSWLIGDILDDVEAGRRAGCHTALVDNGNETQWLMNEWRRPDLRVPDLHTASLLICDHLAAPRGTFS